MTRAEAIDRLRAAVVEARQIGLHAYKVVDTVAEGFYDGNDMQTAATMQVTATRLKEPSESRKPHYVPA
jgi:hypothetical protein